MLSVLAVAMLMTPQPVVDPQGGVVSLQTHRVVKPRVSPGNVQLPSYKFDPSEIPSMPGRSLWIRLDPRQFPAEAPAAAQFRREFELSATPKVAHCWFTADAHARIYVNGVLVGRGPDDGGQDYPGIQTGRWFVTYRDLSPYFHAGRNVICAEVFTPQVMAGRYNSTGHTALRLEANFEMPDGRTETVSTDHSWRGIEGKEWRFAGSSGGGESLQFDAPSEAAGWKDVAFNDQGWPTCTAATDHWPRLVQSELPPRLEANYPWQSVERATNGITSKGSQIRFDRPGSCAVRFDRVLSGFISLTLRGKAGSRLSIEPNERNAPGHNRMATAVLRDGEQTISLPFYDSFAVINITANEVTGPLEIVSVRANMVAQPVQYKGAFECSDPALNQIWLASRWLTQICQQTHHLDSPHHQEPICDPGDYLIISLNNYYAFGQPWLARQDLRKYAWLLESTRNRPFHTSYALLWLQMLLDYYDYTGDASLVQELTPQVHALIAQFATYRGKNGILSEAPDYMFMDWVTIGGFATHHPPAVIGQGYMTAFYYRALADAIRVANLTGDAKLAKSYETQRAEIKAAYQAELWDEAAGLYRDGRPFVTHVKPHTWLPADTAIATHSTQNNVLAVLYDLAPPERRAGIIERLMEHDLNTQPYYMHFVFDAIEHAGLFNIVGNDQMRRWKIQPDTQSFREMWTDGDYSHAWQCTPLYQMSARVLGVTPAAPGFSEISIRPHPGDLAWAKGTVPTPRGDVKVEWKRTATDFRISFTVPAGTTARVQFPFPILKLVDVDGQEPPGWSATFRAGSHTVVARL